MRRFRAEWHRTLVHPISKMLGHAVGGLSGRGKRRRSQVQILEATLDTVCAERDRLLLDIRELVQYTDAEIAQLKQTIDQLHQENDVLQLQIWTLEEQLERLRFTESDASSRPLSEANLDLAGGSPQTGAQANVEAAERPNGIEEAIASTAEAPIAEPLAEPLASPPSQFAEPGTPQYHPSEVSESIAPYPIDLSHLRLALIGGHPSTRRGVIQELQLNYGLRHWVEIPRITESNTNRSKVKSKIRRCTLVVLITGYMSHRLTEIVFSLKEAGALAGDVLQLNCKGKSGVVREILNHVGQASS